MQYLIDYLDEKTTLELDGILRTKLEDIKPDTEFFEYGRTYKDMIARVNTRKSYSSRKIIELIKPFFQKIGLPVNENNGYIEYKSYDYDNTDIQDSGDFYRANEFYAGVHECIIITHKDSKLKRGDVLLYIDSPNELLKLIGYEKTSRIEYETVPGMVIICSGDTIHDIKRCVGKGSFNYITITLYSKKREGYSFDNDDD
jgi:hypothetical protein